MGLEEREVRALEGIKNYMGDLVRVMTAVNQNLVEFGKILKEQIEKEPPAQLSLTEAGMENTKTPEQWMKHLHRWWNYSSPETGDNFHRREMTRWQFLDAMGRYGTEVTDQIPPEKR